MLELLAGFDLPRTVVLTKTDKLKPRKLHAVTQEITATLLSLGHGPRRERGVRGGRGVDRILWVCPGGLTWWGGGMGIETKG